MRVEKLNGFPTLAEVRRNYIRQVLIMARGEVALAERTLDYSLRRLLETDTALRAEVDALRAAARQGRAA
jgi:hypothetical protein